MTRKLPPKVVAAVLLACTVASVALAAWAFIEARKAKSEAQAALAERDRAAKAAADAAAERKQAQAAEQNAERERNQTAAGEQKARRAEEDAQAALAFVRDKVLSAGRPLDWTKPSKKDVTLREAVDAAEPQVAGAFPDRPLAEALVRSTLGWTYFYLGDAESAAQQYAQALALREAVLGPDDPATVGSRNDLARAYRVAGSVDKAGSLYNRESGPGVSAMVARGSQLLAQHRAVQAETILRECLTDYEKTQPDEWSTFNVTTMLGQALLEQKKYADAEPLLLSGYEGLIRREADIPPASKRTAVKAIDALVRLYEAMGEGDKAAHWRKELKEAQAAAKR